MLPVFKPNDYLFEKHADKGERWEVFAWAVRDVMLKTGGFKPCDQSLREKLAYEKYMQHLEKAIIRPLEPTSSAKPAPDLE